MVRGKICGITHIKDAHLAVEAGASALGFIFCDSPRKVDPATVRGITQTLPPYISRVGVFAGETAEQIIEIAKFCLLDTVQLHGYPNIPQANQIREHNLKVIMAVRMKDESSLKVVDEYDADAYHLDTYKEGTMGGTGETFDWSLALKAKEHLLSRGKFMVLAGGLNPENIGAAIEAVHPYAVDTCSGVESEPGRKDPEKVQSYLSALSDERWRSS